jgi:NAD(P)-dependent dehydrogenase (short-subunit alcohol dehydrogenase family)
MIKKVKRRILGKIAKKLAKYNTEHVVQASSVVEPLANYVNSSLLKGKVALVLGASSGIGKACAIELARNGAKVVIAARRKDLLQNVCDQINQEKQGFCKYIVCDVLDIEQIRKTVDFAVEQFGHLDIAVNNVGICRMESILNLTEANYDNTLNSNTKSIAFAMKYECHIMQKQNTLSSIINIGSTLSLVGMGGLVSYTASKHAIVGLTKAAVLDRVTNVRINTICPGAIRTAMSGFADDHDRTPVSGIEKDYPIGRIGEVEDVANAVVFLASDNSTFINGASIPVDGGFICD